VVDQVQEGGGTPLLNGATTFRAITRGGASIGRKETLVLLLRMSP
jgi:hypothetical protein